MAHLHDLLGEDSNITISMTGFDYNYDVHSKDVLKKGVDFKVP